MDMAVIFGLTANYQAGSLNPPAGSAAHRDQMAAARGLRVAGKLPKPFRPKQFAYLLRSLI